MAFGMWKGMNSRRSGSASDPTELRWSQERSTRSAVPHQKPNKMDNNQKSSADHIVEHLLAIGVDGETIEHIIDGTHMREQMLKQLAMKASDQDLNTIMSERDAIHDRGRNSHLTSHHKPNTMQKTIQVDLSHMMVEIPWEQRKLIQKALTFYLEISEKMVRYPSDTDEYERFDMRQLRAMMEYPINIEITPEQRAKFCAKHGMDFPEYD